MEFLDNQPRFFEIEVLEGESLSHFLGRFRRENYLTANALGKLVGIGATIARWEKLYLNPFPSQQELEALANVVRVDVERLIQMLPPRGLGIVTKPRPIRLCSACYQESPCHQVQWQFKDKSICDRHKLRLLCKCTNCETPFPIPADWAQGECTHCSLPFAKMAKRQKPC